MTHPDPIIALLTPGDAPAISQLLTAARREYVMHFHPFAFDVESVRAALSAARKDQYWGIKSDSCWAGIFMMRGLDSGYTVPAFGVFIAEAFAGRGLATRALAAATQWCEQNEIQEMMLTVYAGNTAARSIYERAGFIATGEMQQTRLVMRKKVRG